MKSVHQSEYLLTFHILYFPTMYAYCVYLAKSKGPKQLPNCLKITETSVVLNVFKGSYL